MTILLVTLASIIFTFLLYLAVNYKRVDVKVYENYNGLYFGISYSTHSNFKDYRFHLFTHYLRITVWDEIRDLPF